MARISIMLKCEPFCLANTLRGDCSFCHLKNIDNSRIA